MTAPGDVTPRRLLLVWEDNLNTNVTYNVYSSPTPAGPFLLKTNVATTQLEIHATRPAEFFRVRALNAWGLESEWNY